MTDAIITPLIAILRQLRIIRACRAPLAIVDISLDQHLTFQFLHNDTTQEVEIYRRL